MKTILVDAVHTLITKGEGVYTPLYDLLEAYPNRKVVVTNASEEEMRRLRITEAPYEVFTCAHNPEKTDPAYYQQLLAHYGLDANEVVYFEHNQDAVESARSVGITTHWYNPEARDLPALRAFLDENT